MTDEIINRIKEIKKANSITNEDLAKITGIPISTLNKLLSGYRADFKFGTVMEIATALNTSLDYLAYGNAATPTKAATSEEVQLIANFRRLNKEDQSRVLDYMNTLVIAAMNINASPDQSERLA